MKNTPKTTLILAVVILGFAIYYLSQPHTLITTHLQKEIQPEEQSMITETQKEKIVMNTQAHCALQVTSVKPYAAVTFPIEITGMIDNRNAQKGCRWITFEGQAGTAQLYYDNAGLSWDPIGKPETIDVGDWMSPATPFKVVMSYTNQGRGMKSGTKFMIRFHEEDPSGNTQGQMYDLPVVLK